MDELKIVEGDETMNLERNFYKVGYCKPPYRWPKGFSGNPGGRKPGAVSLEKAIRQELKKNNYKNLEEIISRVFNLAMKGNVDCLQLIFDALH